MKRKPEVAFLGHLESLAAYSELLGAVRGPDLPKVVPERLEAVLMQSEPIPICNVVLRSPLGVEIMARYIDLWLVGEWLRHVSAMTKVRAGCAEAAASGARIAALGGFASIIGERDEVGTSQKYGVAFTTGNTLTAAVIAEQARSLCGPNGGMVVAVVGAGGDVGSGVCRILDKDRCRLLLIGRDARPVQALAAELECARVATWDAAAPEADLVVLVASTTRGDIDLAWVRDDAWVLDAGHPANARRRDHRRYARAGRVLHTMLPESDLPELLTLQYRRGEGHACLAEAEVLAFEQRPEPFSAGRGRIRPERAYEILRLAARHGIVPAPLHFNDD